MSDAALAAGPLLEGTPQRMSRRRRTIGKRLRESVSSKPPVTLHTTASAQVLVDAVEGSARQVSINGFVARAVVRCLEEHRALNAHLSEDTLTTFEEVRLGIAVDLDDGMVVPVIPNAQDLDAASLTSAIGELAGLARAGTLRPEQVLDGTFTISALGALGVEQFTPIINPPHVAVLGVGALRRVPALSEGTWVEAPVLHLSLTFDHAAMDGAPAARFLAAVVDALADPTTSQPAPRHQQEPR